MSNVSSFSIGTLRLQLQSSDIGTSTLLAETIKNYQDIILLSDKRFSKCQMRVIHRLERVSLAASSNQFLFVIESPTWRKQQTCYPSMLILLSKFNSSKMHSQKSFSRFFCKLSARSEFWGVASCVPSLQATLPPSPQIFSVISDTSCHIPYLFFKNTNCVTPPQIIFANLQRFPPKLRFPKNFDL